MADILTMTNNVKSKSNNDIYFFKLFIYLFVFLLFCSARSVYCVHIKA